MNRDLPKVSARFARQTNRLGYYAEVTLVVDPGSPRTTVEVELSGSGFSSQGYIESATPAYRDWIQGAIYGATFGRLTAGKTDCSILVTEILGLGTDTNATIVAAAATEATWKALGFKPSDETRKKMETVVLRSWESPSEEPLSFETG